MLGLPATIGLVLAAQPIIQTLFEHGRFTHADTLATSQTLAAYSLGIPAFLLVKVFAAGFFARHDTATPVRMALIAMAINVACALLLLAPLHYVGIALANSIAVWANAFLLFRRLRRKVPVSDEKLRHRLPRILLSALGMSIVTGALAAGFADCFQTARLAREAPALGVLILGSGIAYGVLAHVTGAMSLKEALAVFRREPKMGAGE
jgi:putative peptidoglycan lipid II flippase